MKNCIDCGEEAPDEAPICSKCGRDFIYRGDARPLAGGTPAAGHVARDRPSGTIPMGIGWTCLAASAICFLLSLRSPATASYDTTYSAVDQVGHAWVWSAISGALFSLFLVLWSVGYIVHAISFLPARPEEASRSSHTG